MTESLEITSLSGTARADAGQKAKSQEPKTAYRDKKGNKAKLFPWVPFVCSLIALHGILLWIDHRPMFFLGDSASYVWTAISGNLPTDRSFLYGYFIRLVAVTAESLESLVAAQAVMTCITSVVMAHLLIRYFHVKPWLVLAVAFCITLEPLQLLYTRYVMTETLALAIFVFYAWVSLHYLEDPQVKWLALIQGIAALLMSIRFAFIPMIWICAIVIPVLACPAIAEKLHSGGGRKPTRCILHVVASIFFLFFFTTAYNNFHGYLQHKPPAYSYDNGFFALSFVFPILQPDDFPDETVGHEILNNVRFSPTDRRNRSANHWMEGGVVARLRGIETDRLKANAVANHAALHAVVHKPLAFLRLAWQTFTDYFDQPYFQSCIKTELGNRPLDEGFVQLLTKHFHYPPDRSSALELQAPTGRYFIRAAHWFQILLFLPLGWGILTFTLHNGVHRRRALLLCLISLVMIGTAILLVERPTPRYLHTAAWLFFFMAAAGLNGLSFARKTRSSH